MNVALWVVAGVLAVLFLSAGLVKLVRGKEQLVATGLGWVEDTGIRSARIIGALEVLAAFGLTLPPALGVAEVLAPLAAIGLIALMAGAAAVHYCRREFPMIGVNAVLLVMASAVAWGRFGPYPFG